MSDETAGVLDWIVANRGAVSALTAIVTAGVWLVYLQLIYVSFRSQRRPMITITRAMGRGKKGHCLIANMSAAPVYILTILALLDDNGRRRVCTLTDEEDLSEGETSTEHTHQGPLETGRHFDLGPFETAIRRASGVAQDDSEYSVDGSDFTEIEILVIALHGSGRRFIGAARHFKRVDSEPLRLRPATLETKQLTGFRSRRRMKKLLRQHL